MWLIKKTKSSFWFCIGKILRLFRRKYFTQLDNELLHACKNGDVAKVKSLSSKIGVNVNTKNNFLQESPLYLAVRLNTEIVQLLLDHGANFNDKNHWGDTPLLLATFLGKTEIVQLFIDRGANINNKSKYSWGKKKTLLHIATQQGHLDVVNLLLRNNANINTKNSDKMTLLHSAAQGGCKEVAKLFLHKKKWINARDKYGRTPLWLSVIDSHIETAQLLIQHGADVDSNSNSEKPLLCHAIEWSSSAVVELLIQKGADINAQGQYGKTPLRCAIERYNKKILFLLLLFGADISEEDRSIINNKPKLANCLAEFEQIKKMPHFGRLVEVYKNRGKVFTSNHVGEDNAKNRNELNKELLFIPKYLSYFIDNSTLKSLKEECVQNFFTLFPEYKLSTSSEVVKKLSSYLNVADCISLPAASADKSR